MQPAAALWSGDASAAFGVRMSGAESEPLKMLSPIFGVAKQPLLPLAEAVKGLSVEGVESFAFVADGKVQDLLPLPHGLTTDEAESIFLYTMGWPDASDSLYCVMNKALRSVKRENIKPFFPYLKLLMTGLAKLPAFNDSPNLWRGVKGDLRAQYSVGKKLVWWQFSSCTVNMGALLNPMFLGKNGDRTLFCIRSGSGVNIRQFSEFPSESEVLLPPATYLQVTNTLDSGNGLYIVEMTEIKPPVPLTDMPHPQTAQSPPTKPAALESKPAPVPPPHSSSSSSAVHVKPPPAMSKLGLDSSARSVSPVSKLDAPAFILWLKAAEQGDKQAQYNVGSAYAYGEGVAKDQAQAFIWYRKAAQQGHAIAQFNVGWSYEKGQGVAKDKAQAFIWYRKAAEQGYAPAQHGVGWLYYNGAGVVKDDAQAFIWFCKAAEHGDADAQCNLGMLYEFGVGVPKNSKQAVEWYNKAAAQGNEKAKKRLEAFPPR